MLIPLAQGQYVAAAAFGLCFILFGLEACLLRKRNWKNNLEKGNQKGNCEKRKGKVFHKRNFQEEELMHVGLAKVQLGQAH